MSSEDLEASRRIWTEYWHGGRRSCLTGDAPASAQTHVESLWRDWFGRLPQRARIIDLACGAGEVARLAALVSEQMGLRFTIDGVDLADCDGASETSSVRLKGGIDLANLPFADKSFDCAVSQFGIEYADVDAACREIAKVMKPQGSGLFLVHHRQSAISLAAASRLQAFADVIADGTVLDSATAVYEAIAARAGELAIKTRLAEFRQQLRRAAESHSRSHAGEANIREIIGFLADLARNPLAYDPFDAIRRISTARAMIAAWKARQEAQRNAARDENGIRSLAATLARFGLGCRETAVVNDPADGSILAWKLELTKTADA